MAVSPDNEAEANHLSRETYHGELLPGTIDGITLQNITPQLSWRDFYSLSSVSRDWRHAIQTRQVYEARVWSHSTEKLVLLNHHFADEKSPVGCNRVHIINLYSRRDNACYELPPLPHLDRGIPYLSRCVTLAGNVYVLGPRTDVYVMDLAGQGQWKQCASMRKPRGELECGVIDGKIYVFGGAFNRLPVREVEVFDPEKNTWAVMEPNALPLLSVAAVRQELFFFSDETLVSQDFDWDKDPMRYLIQAYHPAKDEWRVVELTGDPVLVEAPFTAGGKLYCFSYDPVGDYDISIFDAEKNSWRNIYWCSFAAIQPVGTEIAWLSAVSALGDELLAIVSFLNADRDIIRSNLLRSVGFGGLDKSEIFWQKLECSPFVNCPPCNLSCSMATIEL